MDGGEKRIRAEDLHAFVVRALSRLDVPVEDAATVADVLLAADLRGVDSHGVARLRRYTTGLQRGVMKARPNIRILYETPCSATLDGDAGLGQVIGRRAMELAIQKAQSAGIGAVAVRHSNHYGIAAYYAMLALKHDMIGFSLTNAGPRVVPTFGRTRWLGTNPISVAVPAGEEWPYVLDMATSVVPEGKIEVYSRLGKPIPVGWVMGENGQPETDATEALAMLRSEREGGILPLGGDGEMMSGHKGYGLALLVDILCGVLSGASYAPLVGVGPGRDVGHFFAALRVDLFRPLDEFKAEMDKMIRSLKSAPKAPGHDRIYIHGEKEFEKFEERSRLGIPLNGQVVEDLRKLAGELGIAYDL